MAFPCEASGKESRAVGSDELAEGLMLVRASTMKVVRLQLAMERRDRRLALQTVDDLVDLDGRIRDFLDGMPALAAAIAPMQREMEEQRGCLVREKFTLTAGPGRSAETGLGWIEPALSPDGGRGGTEDAAATTLLLSDVAPPEREAGARRSPWPYLIGAMLLLVAALVCAGILFGAGGWDALIARLPVLRGAA
jgi:hypothetical protein